MKQLGVRTVLVALFFLSVVVAATGPVAGSPALASLEGVDRGMSAQQTTPTNNSTVQHERPDDVEESGDSQQVSQWLETRLAGQLQGSAIEISQGEYESARELVGDDYDSRLEQYVDVAGETEGTEDDETAERFNETRNDQEEYAERVQSYEETYEDYQQARENGNTTAAREHARELENQSKRIIALNQSLNRNYATLENQTGVDTDEARQTISNQSREIETQQETVREQTFVETAVDVTTNGSAIAFTDPLRLTGRLATDNGTSVVNRTIRLQVFQRIYETTTDRNGSFEIVYRPVSLPADATNLTIRYLPVGSSRYLGSDATVPVDVTQETPSLDVRVSPVEAGYHDRVTTQVIATVDGRPVPGLPIRSVLGGTVGTGRTDERGRLALTGRVPASLTSGEQTVVATHDRENRAIGPVSTETPLEVTSTSTTLTVEARTTAERIVVRGRLTTVEGEAVPRQSLSVSIGERVRSTTTNRTGWYQLTVENVSTAVEENQSTLPVVARFDGAGTNLESADAETTVALPQTGEGGDGGNGPGTASLILSGIVAVGALIGALLWFRRDDSSDDAERESPTRPAEAQTTDAAAATTPWLDRAQTALAADDLEQASVAAYTAVREHVRRQTDLPKSLTHREFLTACESAETTVDPARLSVVADAYEQATFAPTLDSTTAAEAVEAAQSLESGSEMLSK